MDYLNLFILLLIIIKLFEMDNSLKDKLVVAIGLIGKVKVDVSALHAKIGALGEAPTPEQLAELNVLADELNNQLASVDDMTADEVVEPQPEPTPEPAPEPTPTQEEEV